MHEDALIEHYIEPNPNRPGLDEVRLKDSGVAVWALIGYFQTPGADLERVAADYEVPVAAVEAAAAYYRRYKGLIDARIALNNLEVLQAA